MNEFFEKESIPEIRALGSPERIRTLRFNRYSSATLKLDTGETWDVSREKLEALQDGRDFMRLLDLPGLCKLARDMKQTHGDRTFKIFADRVEAGDDMAAAEIEKVTTKIESHLLMTTGSAVRDDVMGASPNVPAFLTGSPLCMRTRHNAKTGRGPISLFLETTTSSGFSGLERITRVGAMVSLARALSIHRPLNLWFNVTWGGLGRLTQTSVQIETNPIDVSRIAALCANLETLNSIGSRDSHQVAAAHIAQTGRYWGSWAYDVPILERKFAGEILARVISPGSEVAYLPAGLLGADDLRNPEAWVESMLRKFAPYLYDGTNWEAA
jgi:hypothetical protein